MVIGWAAAIECYRLGASNNKHAFLTVLKAENYKIKIPGGHMSDEDTLPIFLLYPHMAKSRGDHLSHVSSVRTLILFIRAPSS